MPSPSQLAPGDTFERYRIEAFLGRGGMGEVYRALDTRLKRVVALKLLRRDDGRAPDAEEGRRVLAEARALASLSHPNVVTVHDVSQHEGIPYLTMELLEGQSLRRLAGVGGGNVVQRLRWLSQIAGALAAAHRAGLVHRDVKPDNVMVTPAGIVKLLDFGIAKRLDTTSTTLPGGEEPAPVTVNPNATATGTLVGTPKYMSPEQRAGLRADARSDQYAWGLVAHELFTGALPSGDPTLLQRAGVPRGIATIVARALATRADDRYGSMDEIVAALGAMVDATMPAQAAAPSAISSAAATLAPASAVPTVAETPSVGAGPSPQAHSVGPIVRASIAAAAPPPIAPTLAPAHVSRPTPTPTPRPATSHDEQSRSAAARGVVIALWVLSPIVILLALLLGGTAFWYFRHAPLTTTTSPTASAPPSESSSPVPIAPPTPPPEPTATTEPTATAEPTAPTVPTASAAPTASVRFQRPSLHPVDAGAPIAATKDAGVAKPASASHRVSVTTSTKSARLSPASVAQRVAAVQPRVAACYQLPFCEDGQSYNCLHAGDRRTTWTVFVRRDGSIAKMYTAGSFVISACVSKGLEAIAPFEPVDREPGDVTPSFDVVVTVDD